VESNALAGTVTMLFTDIEGSTTLLQTLGAAYGDLVRDHNNLLRAVAAEHGGQVVDTQGDAFFFAFPTARAGLLASVAAQRQLADHHWPDGADVRVRMGMHTGEPELGSEGYLGIDVVTAARICSAAHGGQLLVSASTQALAGSMAGSEIGFRDMGEHRLKGIDRPQRIYQALAPGLGDGFPAIRTNAPEPPSVATMEQRSEALADRIGDAVMAHVERTVEQALAGGGDGGPAEMVPPPGLIMKLSAVGIASLLLLVLVVVAAIFLLRAVL
jgi:class 3 adenylate cyclase